MYLGLVHAVMARLFRLLIAIAVASCAILPPQVQRVPILENLKFPIATCEGVPSLRPTNRATIVLSSNTKRTIDFMRAYQKNLGNHPYFNRPEILRGADPQGVVVDVAALLRSQFDPLDLSSDYEDARGKRKELIIVVDIFSPGPEHSLSDFEGSWTGNLSFFDNQGGCVGSVTSENIKRCPGNKYFECWSDSRRTMLDGLTAKMR
jgi:hypothetical protein